MRRRWIQKPGGGLVEVPVGHQQPKEGPTVWADTPGYVSPVTGLWVEGRKQRREDLKRAGCRPWEGMDQESKEADRQQTYREQKSDQRLDHAIRSAYYQLSPEKRRLLEQ